jgi:hypothetical protein
MVLTKNIDDILHLNQLICVTNYVCEVGDCLFDFIVFMLQYPYLSNSLCMNPMIYFKYCLQMQTPLAMHYRQSKLNPKNNMIYIMDKLQ